MEAFGGMMKSAEPLRGWTSALLCHVLGKRKNGVAKGTRFEVLNNPDFGRRLVTKLNTNYNSDVTEDQGGVRGPAPNIDYY